jgi:hypothetical protein
MSRIPIPRKLQDATFGRIAGTPSPTAAPPLKPKRSFAPIFLDDIDVDEEPAYIVDGIIPAGPSFGEIPAPPKSLKSFFLADLLMHIGIGKDYAGRKVQQGAVVYITSEGVQGVKRRLVAMRKHHGVEGDNIGFALIPVMPNLGSGTEDLEMLKAEITRAIKPLNVPVRAIVIDTLRRATPGKSENDPKDMSVFLANADALAQAFTCFVGVAHHSPRSDDSRGSGTNAIEGACDVILPVTRCDIGDMPRATVTIGRMKDGEEGDTWTFEVHSMQVGTDRNGNPKFGGYVVLFDEPAQRVDDTKVSSTRLPKAAQIALRALGEAVEECGELPPASNHIPPKVKTVTEDQWLQYAYRRGISTGEERAKQQAFKRAHDYLIASQHVGEWDSQVWLTK